MTARSSVFRRITAGAGAILLACAAGAGIIFEGDGSNEPGFVPPPRPKAPPPPPANISGGETFIPYPGPPAQPQSRSEKKNPPRPPVMFTKLTSEYGEIDWNARPNDLNNLLNALKAMADVNYDCDHKSFAEIDPDPARNPILYRSGHFHWHLNAQEKAKLREYLLRGGTLILNAGMGSKPFYDSALRIMGEVFPETPVQRLAAPALQRGVNESMRPVSALGHIFRLIASSSAHGPRVDADIIVNDELSLREFGVAGRAISTPGHTPGSLSVVLDNGEVIIGDLLMGSFIRRHRPMLPFFADDVAQLRRSLSRLLEMEPKRIYASHGREFDCQHIIEQLMLEATEGEG